MGETVTVKWANSCLYFLCRANTKIKLSSQLCRKTFSPRTNEIKMAEVAQRDVFSPFPLVVAMRVFCWRWMPGRLAASVRAAQMRFTVETERKKEILLASQHECGWLLIEWRGCFVLLLQWKSCTRRKAIYALQREKKGKKKNTEAAWNSGKSFSQAKPTCDGTVRVRILYMFFTVEHQ